MADEGVEEEFSDSGPDGNYLDELTSSDGEDDTDRSFGLYPGPLSATRPFHDFSNQPDRNKTGSWMLGTW
jgi:hypothetical protein